MELLTLLPGVVVCGFPLFSSFADRPLAPCNEVWEPATPFGPSAFVCACTFSKFFFDLKRNAIAAPEAELQSAYANAPETLTMKLDDVNVFLMEFVVKLIIIIGVCTLENV